MKLRRLVNIHTTGRYAGIYHIHGVEPGPAPLGDHQMPTPVGVTLLDGRERLCEMVGSTERTVFYQEAV